MSESPLDLVLEREIDVPVEMVWAAWTTPEHIKHWFAPKPVEVPECEIDLRPGGKFRTVMVLPDGTRMDNSGCYLEVVPHTRLVFTDALEPGFRPSAAQFFTGKIELEDLGNGRTKYRATAIHGTQENADHHRKMGFFEGWGTALDQLVEFTKGQQAAAS